MGKDTDIIKAAKELRAFSEDIRKGELYRGEDGGGIDGKFFQVGSPGDYSYFKEL